MTKEEAIKMFLDDGAAELSVKAEQGGGARHGGTSRRSS